jgi:hypothetical protein
MSNILRSFDFQKDSLDSIDTHSIPNYKSLGTSILLCI